MLGISVGFLAKLFACLLTKVLTASFLTSRSAFMLNIFSWCFLFIMKLSSFSTSWVLCSFSLSLTFMTSQRTSFFFSSAVVAKYTAHDSSCISLIVVIPPSIGNFIHKYWILMAISKSYKTGRPRITLYTSGSLTTKIKHIESEL